MKKVIAMFVNLCLCISLCSCGEAVTPPRITEPEITEPVVVFPKVQMIINSNKENTTTELRVFPSTKYSDLRTAYAHYYVTAYAAQRDHLDRRN